MEVLAIAGSLRAASINRAYVRAAARLAPAGVRISVYEELGELPLFNPDLEECLPPAAARLRDAAHRADALLIASPEYAHGISGVMKNALDWLVGCERFPGKPVAVVNTAPHAHLAYDSLVEVLRTMSATIVSEASIALPMRGNCVTEPKMVAHPRISAEIADGLRALQRFLGGA